MREGILASNSIATIVKNNRAELQKNIRTNVRLAYYENKAARGTLDGKDYTDINKIVSDWYKRNLPTVENENGETIRRDTVVTKDGHRLFVGKRFFEETFNKLRRFNDSMVATTMKDAIRYKDWIGKAVKVKEEVGRDHIFGFDKYRLTYNGSTLEFKVKKSSGEIMYVLRVF